MMSKISMALRKASVQHQRHHVNDAQEYKPVGGVVNQKNRRPTLNALLLLSVISFGLMLAGGVGAFYHARIKYVEDDVEYKNSRSYIVAQQENILPSSHVEPKIYQNIKLGSLENERKLLTNPNLRIDRKPESPSFYTIQVGAFLNPEYATETLKRLKKEGHSSVVISQFSSTQGIWRRVHVGEFAVKSEAESYLSRIKKDYNDSYIIMIQH